MQPADSPFAKYPNVEDPNEARKADIKKAIDDATEKINKFLAPEENGLNFIDTVFGAKQRNTAIATYQAILKVLDTWSNTPGKVKLSGWLSRFGRDAHTNPTDQVVTLPISVMAEQRDRLPMILVHEASHAANKNIVDYAYSGVGFKTMPGPQRLLNAPYFDYTVKAWMAGAVGDEVGNPNTATGAEVGVGAPQQSMLGVQFQRAQSLITHARIHAENMLEHLVAVARGETKMTQTVMDWSTGLPMPILNKYSKSSVVRSPQLSADDIEAADRFVVAVAALHDTIQKMEMETRTPPPVEIDKDKNTITFFVVQNIDMKAQPIKNGDLAEDPLLNRIITTILTTYEVEPSSRLTSNALGKVDQQYHAARSQASHP